MRKLPDSGSVNAEAEDSGEKTTDREALVCAVVKCRVCKLTVVFLIFLQERCDSVLMLPMTFLQFTFSCCMYVCCFVTQAF